MDYLFFQMIAVNGFDGLGHYLRAGLIVNLCSTYTHNAHARLQRQLHGGPDRRAPADRDSLEPRLAEIAKKEDSTGSVPPAGTLFEQLVAPQDDEARRERERRLREIRRQAEPALARPRRRARAAARLPAGSRGMSRRGRASIAASPVLVGAVTLLVSIVAIFLSYNANSGLPFVPTYDLKARLPNAANLVAGNEVRIGGARVGVIDEIEPVPSDSGDPAAELSMKLDADLEPLPVDSTFLVRPRSALGLKYVELTPGEGGAGFPAGRGRAAEAGHTPAGRVRRGAQHVRPGRADRCTVLAERLRRGPGRPRAEPERGDRGPEPAARGPRARGAQPRRPGDAARPDLQGAGGRGGRGGAGGGAAGGAVREPRLDLRRARDRGAAVPPGDDLRVSADARDGDGGVPQAAAVPAQHHGLRARAAARHPHAAGLGARPGRRARVRHRRRCRRPHPSTGRWPTSSTRSPSSPRTRWSRAASAACARPSSRCGRRSPSSRRPRRSATT